MILRARYSPGFRDKSEACASNTPRIYLGVQFASVAYADLSACLLQLEIEKLGNRVRGLEARRRRKLEWAESSVQEDRAGESCKVHSERFPITPIPQIFEDSATKTCGTQFFVVADNSITH